jgi:hypothetical protein
VTPGWSNSEPHDSVLFSILQNNRSSTTLFSSHSTNCRSAQITPDSIRFGSKYPRLVSPTKPTACPSQDRNLRFFYRFLNGLKPAGTRNILQVAIHTKFLLQWDKEIQAFFLSSPNRSSSEYHFSSILT